MYLLLCSARHHPRNWLPYSPHTAALLLQVHLPLNVSLDFRVADAKLLSRHERGLAFEELCARGMMWASASIAVHQIDTDGHRIATAEAMRSAVRRLQRQLARREAAVRGADFAPTRVYCLVDGDTVPSGGCNA